VFNQDRPPWGFSHGPPRRVRTKPSIFFFFPSLLSKTGFPRAACRFSPTRISPTFPHLNHDFVDFLPHPDPDNSFSLPSDAQAPLFTAGTRSERFFFLGSRPCLKSQVRVVEGSRGLPFFVPLDDLFFVLFSPTFGWLGTLFFHARSSPPPGENVDVFPNCPLLKRTRHASYFERADPVFPKKTPSLTLKPLSADDSLLPLMVFQGATVAISFHGVPRETFFLVNFSFPAVPFHKSSGACSKSLLFPPEG